MIDRPMIPASSLVSPDVPPADRHAYRGWIAYAAAWAAGAGLWTLVSATSARLSPLRTLPYGLLMMGTAGVLGVGVWRLTGLLSWPSRRVTFYVVHATAVVLYAFAYASAGVIPDLIRGDLTAAAAGIRQSPVLLWNVLMGSWLYLTVAGLSYAVRSERARVRDAATMVEAKLLAQSAQLTALRAQLNPHFLFNALHTVSALISHDPAGADRAIERLGELLRYAMADDELVPLAAEWRFVRDYLAFEQLRLGDRLRVVDHLDPAAADRLVPPLLLQPIVENAVRHGVAVRPEGGCIHVEAHVDGDTTIVRIADDGPGDGGSGGGDVSGAAGGEENGGNNGRQGLGLASVRRRLAVVFGARADLRIDTTQPGAGYIVLLTIPESVR